MLSRMGILYCSIFKWKPPRYIKEPQAVRQINASRVCNGLNAINVTFLIKWGAQLSAGPSTPSRIFLRAHTTEWLHDYNFSKLHLKFKSRHAGCLLYNSLSNNTFKTRSVYTIIMCPVETVHEPFDEHDQQFTDSPLPEKIKHHSKWDRDFFSSLNLFPLVQHTYARTHTHIETSFSLQLLKFHAVTWRRGIWCMFPRCPCIQWWTIF